MNSQQQQPLVPIQDSQEPSQESQQLVALFADMEKKQLDFIDESSKGIIERIATFLAVLFGVTVLSGNFPPPYLKANLTAKVLVIVTLVFYLSAMGTGIWVIQPRHYRNYTYDVTKLGKELEKITKHKIFWLRAAGCLFALGSVALGVLIISIIWGV